MISDEVITSRVRPQGTREAGQHVVSGDDSHFFELLIQKYANIIDSLSIRCDWYRGVIRALTPLACEGKKTRDMEKGKTKAHRGGDLMMSFEVYE